MKTRAQMIEDYGSIPMGMSEHRTWTIHRAHATVSWTTDDGGETWNRKSVVYAEERERRDLEANEQARIQRELK